MSWHAHVVVSTLVAHAALVAVTGGKLVNDTDHNITWAADGNLFLAHATQNGDAAAFVATIISDWGMPFVFNINNSLQCLQRCNVYEVVH